MSPVWRQGYLVGLRVARTIVRESGDVMREIERIIEAANTAYQEFLATEPGSGSAGRRAQCGPVPDGGPDGRGGIRSDVIPRRRAA